ncbi:MAG: sugar phosphate isomerase/epimerase [Cyclobacteriaceae bacterium]|nr:sugar phosphate isomerase/epimerase [Cyclobacteriaceae bacterium]
MNCKIGFNLLAWSAVVSDDLRPMVDRLKEIGYDGVEFAMAQSDTDAYKRLGKHAIDLGMEVNFVLALGADENPIHESPAVRQKALDKMKWAIDRAHDLDAKVICGPFHSAFAVFAMRPPTEQEYHWSSDILRQAGDYASRAGVTLALEAINRFECYLCNTVAQVDKILKETDHPSVKAMYDTHHANIEEKGIKESIDLLGPNLVHVHICENDRGTPGDGHIPWDETFQALASNGYKGWLTIEAFTRNDPAFADAINVWREFSKPWDVARDGLAFIKRMGEKYNL